MTTGRPGPGRFGPQMETAARLVALGRLDFNDFARLDDATLRSALTNVPPDNLADLLVRHPAVLRRALEIDPPCLRRFAPSASLPGPLDRWATGPLILSHAFDLLAAKSPALYETLPWFDWDTSLITARRPLWRTRFLLAGDSATITAARLRRAAAVTIAEP
ncbi:MAG TPA: hypothetical protein ENN51_04725, partial [candidate division WOR-3 bacterium]|nr:hypothetical protein [candidate division WOR-3 bacterium]